jgi:hypothetical protein
MSLNLGSATDGQILRLEAIQKHLKVAASPWDEGFEAAVIAAVERRIQPILKAEEPTSADELVDAMAIHFGVHFEVVRTNEDIAQLQNEYVKTRRELGFAVLSHELQDPNVDALLFQLANPNGVSSHVSVLNLRGSSDREFWNKIHELTHRISEPAQLTLAFRGHFDERQSPVERLVDAVAANVAFCETYFRPIVARHARRHRSLTISVVDAIRNEWAPSASFLAVANAVTRYWPHPVMVLVAEHRGRFQDGRQTNRDVALRVDIHGRNAQATSIGMVPKLNWRVPSSSPLYSAFYERRRVEDVENLGDWTTSRGTPLPPVNVVTSAGWFGKRAYAIVTCEDMAA